MGLPPAALKISITTAEGELLEQIIIVSDKAECELPIAERARRVTDYIGRRYDVIGED